MKEKINKLKRIINKGEIPKKFQFFAGANLIITDDPKRNYLNGDILVITEHAAAFSWLVFQLKDIYKEKLNYQSKYRFYPLIGELITEASASKMDIFDQMLFTIDGIESRFIKTEK